MSSKNASFFNVLPKALHTSDIVSLTCKRNNIACMQGLREHVKKTCILTGHSAKALHTSDIVSLTCKALAECPVRMQVFLKCSLREDLKNIKS